jgi:hypothetical protein
LVFLGCQWAMALFLPHGRTGTGPVRTFIRVADIFRSLIDHFGKITVSIFTYDSRSGRLTLFMAAGEPRGCPT